MSSMIFWVKPETAGSNKLVDAVPSHTVDVNLSAAASDTTS